MNQSLDNAQALPVWDKSGVLKRLMNNEDLLAKLLEKFKQNLITSLPPLEQAVAESEAASCEKICHKITGSAKSLGAMRIANVSQHMEALAKQRPLTTWELDQLKLEINAFFAHLNSESSL